MEADRRVDQLLASPLGREYLLHLVEPRAEVHLDWSSPGAARRSIGAAVSAGGGAARSSGPGELLAALARVTFPFGFSDHDEWLWPLTGAARDTLRPIAQALVAAAEPFGWWAPVDRSDQRLVAWDDTPDLGAEGIEGVVRRAAARARQENEEGWRRSRPRGRRGHHVGARWWSAPDFAPLTWTTAAVAPLPATALLGFVDTHQPFEPAGARVFSLTIDPAARIHEIAGPEDWRRLVERFPRDATGTHDGEWRRWGGAAGPWVLPDWEAVMARYDGVHVTVGGYLASCGLALPVGEGFTMLAGWVPDATLWLHDVVVARRLLGRWHGTPTADAGEVVASWEPA